MSSRRVRGRKEREIPRGYGHPVKKRSKKEKLRRLQGEKGKDRTTYFHLVKNRQPRREKGKKKSTEKGEN